MSRVLGYVRLDGATNERQRTLLCRMVQDLAKTKGFEAIPSDYIRIDACSLLTPINERDCAKHLARELAPGDALVTTHFGSLLAHPSSALTLLRALHTKGVPLYVAEAGGTDVTTLMHIWTIALPMFSFWEGAVVGAEKALVSAETFHAEMLEEYSAMALKAMGERLAKTDFASIIRDCVAESSAKAAEAIRAGRTKEERKADIEARKAAALARLSPEKRARLINGATDEAGPL